jgi:hypothetical protein
MVLNNRGKAIYMSSFDKVIEDLYGYPNFSRKIANSYDDCDIMDVIDKIGVDRLRTLFANTSNCNVIRDLVKIKHDCGKVRKELRKQQQKGNRDKDLAEKYKYLSRLYRRALKRLRKQLGIRNIKTAYRDDYPAARSIVNDGDDWNGGFREFSFGDDDYDPYYIDYDDGDEEDDDYDEEYDYDYSSTSELDDFVQMMHGYDPTKGRGGPNAPRRANTSRPKQKRQTTYESEWADDDEEYEDEEAGYRMEQKYDALYHKVGELSDAVQALASQAEYDRINHRNMTTHEPVYGRQPVEYNAANFQQQQPQPQPAPSQQKSTQRLSDMDDIRRNMNAMNATMQILVTAMKGFQEWQQDIDSAIYESDGEYEEEEDPNYVDMSDNGYEDDAQLTPSQINYGDSVIQKDPQTMSREEMIDEINRTQPMKTQWSGQTQAAESSVTTGTKVTVEQTETTVTSENNSQS